MDLFINIILYVVFLLMAFWNLMIAIIGLFPRFRGRTTGTLTKTSTQKNVPGRYGPIPILTRYVYTYTVNGKKYQYSGTIYNNKQHLHRKVAMMFVKGFPRHSHPNKLNCSKEWIIGSFMLFMSIAYTVLFIFWE